LRKSVGNNEKAEEARVVVSERLVARLAAPVETDIDSERF